MYKCVWNLRKASKLLPIVLICCGESSNSPTPIITPSSSPDPITYGPIPEFTGTMFVPPLVGGAYCCWRADKTIADLRPMADAGLNATLWRMGPFADNSDNLADTVRVIQAANQLGMLPIVSLVDGWCLEHGCNLFGDDCSIAFGSFPSRYAAHVTSAVEAIEGSGGQVIYDLGNELWKCDPTKAFKAGIYNTAKAAGAKWIGCNGKNCGPADFHMYEGWFVVGRGEILYEDDGELHLAPDWIDMYRRTKNVGGYLIFYRGDLLNDLQWQEVLNAYKLETK